MRRHLLSHRPSSSYHTVMGTAQQRLLFPEEKSVVDDDARQLIRFIRADLT